MKKIKTPDRFRCPWCRFMGDLQALTEHINTRCFGKMQKDISTMLIDKRRPTK